MSRKVLFDEPGPYPPLYGRSPGQAALEGMRELVRHEAIPVEKMIEAWLPPHDRRD